MGWYALLRGALFVGECVDWFVDCLLFSVVLGLVCMDYVRCLWVCGCALCLVLRLLRFVGFGSGFWVWWIYCGSLDLVGFVGDCLVFDESICWFGRNLLDCCV